MPKQPGQMGIGEARLYAIRDRVIANLPSLQMDLQADPVTQKFVTAPFGGVNDTQVRLGELKALWRGETGALRFRVMAGTGTGSMNNTDVTAAYYTIGGADNKKLQIYTGIGIYIHPTCWRTDDVDAQEEEREILRMKLCDWGRFVFNSGAASGDTSGQESRVIYLKSREYSATWQPDGAGGYPGDPLQYCRLTTTSLNIAPIGVSGGQYVWCVALTHQGEIAG